jgi:malate synthase
VPVAAEIEIVGPIPAVAEGVLTDAALELAARLQRELGARRNELLAARAARQLLLDAGGLLDFLPETQAIREGDWQVAAAPPALQDRRVEITGPAEPKMMINALNSGARVFMCDLEDALSPTWDNVLAGQVALSQAIRRELEFTSPEGKHYRLNDEIATLIVRPRGWHLEERHLLIDDRGWTV